MPTPNAKAMPLGALAPDFNLPDPVGKMHSLRGFTDARGLLVIFMCNHCPYVKHVADAFAQLARDYQAQGVAVVAISSNDVSTHPGDSPEQMVHEAQNRGYTFPYLYDETQQVAQAYRAACTPDFYVFDKQRKLAYRGQMDASRPDSGIPVTGKELRAALDAVLAGKPAAEKQTPSIGCNIKWKRGSEPDYFK